jgi:hypothetical protein
LRNKNKPNEEAQDPPAPKKRQRRRAVGYTDLDAIGPLDSGKPLPVIAEKPQGDISIYGYSISRVLRAWRSRVLQLSVLEPVLGRHLAEGGKSPRLLDKQFIAALNEVQERWRVFAQNLFDVIYYRMHCSPTVADKMLIAAKMCPPFGVKTTETFNVCSMAAVCPFCYGRRYIRDLYKHFEHWVYGSPLRLKGISSQSATEDDPLHPYLRIDPRYAILSVLATRRYETAEPIGFIQTQRLENYARTKLRHLLFQDRLVEINRTQAPVSASLARIVPETGAVRAELGSVMIVERRIAEYELGASPSFVKMISRPVTKENLAYAFAEAFSYPADLMTCNTAALAALLKGLSGLHMKGSYARRVQPGFAVQYTKEAKHGKKKR